MKAAQSGVQIVLRSFMTTVSHPMMIAAALGGILTFSCVGAAGQQAAGSSGTTTLQVYSRLTVLDVTATDASGRPVHELQQSDFTVLEDGKPQTIRNFEEVKAEWIEPPREMPPNVYTNIQRPAPSRAVNVLLLDLANETARDSTDGKQLSRSLDTQKRVKQAAMQALGQMPEGTRVAVLAMTNNLRIVQSFTSDRALLVAAINAVPYDLEGNGMPAGPGGREHNGPGLGAQDTSGGQGVQADMRNRMVLEALDRIAIDTAGIKARKNVIWFTAGVPAITDPNERPASLPDYSKGLSQTYDLLTASQVSVYPVDVYGPDVLGARQLSEASVAEATGGVAYSGTNDMASAVLKAIDNGANYYSIAFVPSSDKYDGAYHKIDVKVNRQGVHLVFRKGYFADDVAKIKMPPGLTMAVSPPLAPNGNMKAPMSRGLPIGSDLLFEVGVQPSTVAAKPGDPPVMGTLDPKLRGKKLERYGFQYVVPAEQIKFSNGPNGTHKGAVQFDVAVFDQNDKLLTGISQTLSMPLSDATYKDLLAKRGPVRFFQQIDLPPGQLFLRMGVLDQTTNKVGTLELPLNVGKSAQRQAASGAE